MAAQSPRARKGPAGGLPEWDDPAAARRGSEAGGASSLARFLDSLRRLPSPEARTDATLADLVDSVLQSMHVASVRARPSTRALMRGFTTERRQETLVWLVQAFDVMHFQDSLLFDVVLLLDRYYACDPLYHGGSRESHGGESQRKLLAAVYVSLKTGSSMDTQVSLKQLVCHDLGKDQIPFEDILDAELAILQKLRFRVGTPTAHDFLETLDTRLKHEYASDACLNLADFLLQLSLSDASLHYKYSHSILAASALALALYATQAPSSAFVALVEDLSLHCPAMPVPHAEMVECCDALHQLWILGVSFHEQYTFTRYLWAKFSRSGRSSASHIAPPPRPARPLLPAPAWAATGLGQGHSAPERGYPAQQLCAPPRRGAAPAERLGLALAPSAVPAPWGGDCAAPRKHHRGGA